ncbi:MULTISPECIES: flagellar hook-basal body complex protein FliE [Pseudoalteromonas]|jgi:flagellar hook-basal body complex protein FliE|uniref:Flagellar hook-basal body complex protein FliE n=1 Tax=Pseudoalteromonas lipolytica TaxID=570156 RepID=A0ABU8ST80_9GAMM|nr:MULTISPECIES: flagellar hook-basal body complex protein FliE [unclassified Pseudoalteromonas]MED5513711.1 flagellar hook-basal body complex protein FliE [Pseudomonadota bacterium]MCF2847154.1 flagellar hook-basal body complex protein FliE [Pseudoalteromonas sp. PAST1]MCF2916796.1 flagellar hook-basal body complex protein FliE [Pseudoalteromonas sp. Cn5-37]MCO7210900.1 flagellar hook-basal body complex protein FliE [Pseudoalteromonas sp. ACER1]TMP15905.1 flagellar hook-basal body complex pro|tara:strand:+ start:455 stop:787 length:333 start_codon:yes stop_codon:yes gene_type:complete
MKVQNSALFQEMQSMASEVGRGNSINNLPTQTQPTSSAQFGDLLTNALDTVNGLQQEAKQKVTALEMGDRSVSLADVMIASQKSSVAFEATVQVRNKLVEAYKEIMNMPV